MEMHEIGTAGEMQLTHQNINIKLYIKLNKKYIYGERKREMHVCINVCRQRQREVGFNLQEHNIEFQ